MELSFSESGLACIRAFRCLLVGVFASSIIAPACALEVDITAEFTPDPLKPQVNVFKNTTPVSGYCSQFPHWCGPPYNIFSIQTPITFQSSGKIVSYHSSERQGAMFKIPADWRALTVRHWVTGETRTIKVRITGIGSTYNTDDVRGLIGDFNETIPRAHDRLWGGGGSGAGSWQNPPLPCTFGSESAPGPRYFKFFWKTPALGVCAKQAVYDIPSIYYNYLEFSYELDTPNPLLMPSGRYTGRFVYEIGPGRDFDMGDIMIPSDGALILNFTLDVDHVLKVDIPPGGNHVELVPEGGWQVWLQNPARAPEKLFRDQTFLISASGAFSMHLMCSHDYGDDCGIRNAEGHGVPVRVRVSLPTGLTDSAGLPVVRQNLYRNSKQRFQPGIYFDRKPATLHFALENHLGEVLRDHAGSTYSGTITVVWDSNI